MTPRVVTNMSACVALVGVLIAADHWHVGMMLFVVGQASAFAAFEQVSKPSSRT